MASSSKVRLFIPNAFTAGNIVVGFMAMLSAADGRFDHAVYLLVIAVFMDLFDGRLARWLGATSKFGQEMDSFSDALSFVAAPAFLVHLAVLAPLGSVGMLVSWLYLLCGVFRLARFNLTSDVHAKARRTVGAPTPIGAGYVMALVLMRDQITPEIGAFVVLCMGLLMVSRIRLPEISGRGIVAFCLLIGIGNYMALVFWPNWYTVIWWNLWNIVILWAAKIEGRNERWVVAD